MTALRKQAWIGLIVLIGVAGVLRLWHLDRRMVGHIEMYVPNLPLPDGISDPPPRPTLVKTLTGSLWEPHPPAWYLLNFPWTLAFGTSPTAMRLPSVLCGAASVWLLWVFAAAERSRRVAFIAATLLALNGFHVLWSQIARPVALVSLLGLATSILLLRIRTRPPALADIAAFVGLSGLGLVTDYYFWLLFAGQMAWVFATSTPEARRSSALFTWQWLIVIAGSPLVTLAVFQSRDSYLQVDVPGAVVGYIGFGFLFEPVEGVAVAATWLVALAFVAGLVLLLAGFRHRPRPAMPSDAGSIPAPPRWLFWLVTAGAVAAALGAAAVLSAQRPEAQSALFATAVLPPLLAACAMVSTRLYQRGILHTTVLLSEVIAVVPPVLAATVSLVMPFLDSKYFLIFSPFLFVVMAEGLVGLGSAWQGVARTAMAVVGVVILSVLHAAGLRFNAAKPMSPIDYRTLAAQLVPLLEDSDLIFTYRHYAITPIYYYLPGRARQLVGMDHREAITQHPGSRIWLVSLRDTQIADPAEISAAVRDCVLSRTLTATRIRAELFESCRSDRESKAP